MLGIAAPIALAILCCCVAAALLVYRRRRRSKDKADTDEMLATVHATPTAPRHNPDLSLGMDPIDGMLSTPMKSTQASILAANPLFLWPSFSELPAGHQSAHYDAQELLV